MDWNDFESLIYRNFYDPEIESLLMESHIAGAEEKPFTRDSIHELYIRMPKEELLIFIDELKEVDKMNEKKREEAGVL